MIYIIVGVFLVLIIMNLFLFIIIRQMSRVTGRQIEKDAMRLSTVYDRLLEEKSGLLKNMEQELLESQEKAENIPLYGRAQDARENYRQDHYALLSSGHYRSSGFTEAYHRVGETFRCSAGDVLSCVSRLKKEASGEFCQLSGILQTFTFHQVCRVMALEEETQKNFIRSALGQEDCKVYDRYVAVTGRFELSGFLDYVRNESRFLDHGVMVYTGNKTLYEDLLKEKKSGMEVRYDEGICEGFKLVQGSRMYDYSI